MELYGIYTHAGVLNSGSIPEVSFLNLLIKEK